MMTDVLAVILVAGGVWAARCGARLVMRALRHADEPSSSLSLIRGIRRIVVAIAAWALAAGVVLSQTWLLVFSGVFLAEELYETGIVALVLRRAARTAA